MASIPSATTPIVRVASALVSALIWVLLGFGSVAGAASTTGVPCVGVCLGFNYDSSTDVAPSRGAQQPPSAVLAVSSERAAVRASSAVPHIYDKPLSFVAPQTTHRFPDTAAGMSQRLGVDPVVSVTKDGTPRNRWFPNERITMEGHPEGLALGAPGFNPRHHGEHFHVQIRPDSTTGWNNPAVTKSHPLGYTPGSGTGFLPGEEFPS